MTLGCHLVKDDIPVINAHIPLLREIEALLNPSHELTLDERKRAFDQKASELINARNSVYIHIGSAMRRWGGQLFADFEALNIPVDNLDLERAFRFHKHFDRKITGGQRCRTSLVRTGETLLPAIDAHIDRDCPYEALELLPYIQARIPPGQLEATRRHGLVRQARSAKTRERLMQQLEQCYEAGVAATELKAPAVEPKRTRDTKVRWHPSRRSVRLLTSRELAIHSVNRSQLHVQGQSLNLH